MIRRSLILSLVLLITQPSSAFVHHGGPSYVDPTVGLIASTSDGYANWTRAGLQAVPLTASIATNGTMTVTYSPSLALGPSQVISCAGCPGGETITAFGTGTGGTGTYTVSPAPSSAIASEAMTANGIPNRTTVYTTLSPSGGNDTSAIQTALNNCPAGEVVLLNTGVYQINGDSLQFSTSSCTLRGSGVGALVNTGINAVGDDNSRTVGTACTPQTSLTVSYYCVDSTATQLIQIDRATNGNGPLLGAGSFGGWSTSYSLASDAVQGAYSVTLSTTPSGLSAGTLVWIDENTTSDPNIVYGPSFAGNFDLRGYGERAIDYSLTQILEIASVNGNTVTFDSPVGYPFHTAYSATLTKFTNTPAHGIGIENLFLWGGMGGNGQGNIGMTGCAYCWVKNVESAWSQGGIQMTATFRSVLRDSFLHETPDPTPGGLGYMMAIDGGASENLVENNISWYGNKEDVIRISGAGNVVAYNYMDDAFDETNPDQPEAGVNSAHLTTSYLTLLEGNYSQNFKGDAYWGNSIYITAFRNWLSQKRAAHAPLNTYYTTGNNCNEPYGDYQGFSRGAVDLQAGSYYNNIVGNVLGTSGQSLLTEPSGHSLSPCYPAQAGWVLQVTTASDWTTINSGNYVPIWMIGAYQATVNQNGGTYTFSDCSGSVTVPSGGGWTFDHCTINTITRTANWDWNTSAEHCYGTGGITDLGCSGITVPASFYLISAPPFFGSHTWPWVNPATGAVATLPAMYCFQHGEMPTCTVP